MESNRYQETGRVSGEVVTGKKDTLHVTLCETDRILLDCGALIVEIAGKCHGTPAPQDKANAPTPTGIYGASLQVRNGAQAIREALANLSAELA